MKPYVRITLAYLVFGVLWIIVSDLLAFLAASDSESLTQVQVLKGWLYVFLSSALIYYLTRQAFLHREKMRRERRALFLKTVFDSYDILLNYLNQMQLVILEAEKAADFDREILVIAKRVSKECSEKIKALENLEVEYEFESEDLQANLIQVRKKLDVSSRLGES